jgi:hypothetical protein
MPRFSFLIFLLSIFTVLLSECSNPNAAKPNTFGELDRKVIAADTAMEANMDLSYEYTSTLVESDSVVYDFLAYDKPKGDTKIWESKFHLIRRTGINQDTIAKDYRQGKVKSIWLSDLDQDGKSEIMFYESPKQDSQTIRFFEFYAYQTNGRQKVRTIRPDFRQDPAHYLGGDTFFVYQNRLIRKFPFHKNQNDLQVTGETLQSYTLRGNRLELEKEKIEN